MDLYCIGDDLGNIVLTSSDYPLQVGTDSLTLDVSATNIVTQKLIRLTFPISISKYAHLYMYIHVVHHRKLYSYRPCCTDKPQCLHIKHNIEEIMTCLVHIHCTHAWVH